MKTRKHTGGLSARLGLCLALCLVLLPLLSLSPAASIDASSAPGGVICHMAGTLFDPQLESLTSLARTESNRCGVPLYAVVTSDDYYTQYTFMNACGYSSSDDLVLLIVFYDTSETTWYYDLYTFGAAVGRITDREVDRILDADDVYDNLKSGHIEAGLRAFFPLASTAVLTDLKAPVGKLVTFSLIGALIIAGVAVLIVVLRYRMKIKPTNYPLDQFATLKPGAANDVFTGSTVTSHTVSSSSGSGGSGGSHGGGGGHRGGR